jgi:DNA-directed RNA polymerase specialized sigma24 family protein
MPNYCDRQEFLNLILEYKKTKDEKVYNELGKIFLLIAINVLNKPYFINRTQDRKDEMVSEAVFNMIRYLNTFDEKKYDNPFAYFTRTAINAAKQIIKNYKISESRYVSLSFIDNFETNNECYEND